MQILWILSMSVVVGGTPLEYHLTIIDSPQLDSGLAAAINNAGQVVGFLRASPNGPASPYIWQRGELTLLPLASGHGGALGISDNGNVSGANVLSPSTAVKWIDGKEIPLESPPGWFSVAAFSITDDGVANGSGWHDIAVESAISWPSTTAVLQPATVIFATNRAGIHCGRANSTAVIIQDGVVTSVGPQNVSSWANDINDRGDVVGYSCGSGVFCGAFLDPHDGPPVSLPLILSEAWAINNHSIVVGVSYADGIRRAIRWKNSEPTALRDFFHDGFQFRIAFDINDAGQIVGESGDNLAFLLTPTASLPGMFFFSECLTGPGSEGNDLCISFDAVADQRIDLLDYSKIQNLHSTSP